MPYPDTIRTLHALHSAGIPVAVVSNIGWDPRPVLRTYGTLDLLDVLVLSDERGVQKPDPAIFRLACTELAIEPTDALMVGDNADTDGAATAIGRRFVLVPPQPSRPSDTLLRAVFG